MWDPVVSYLLIAVEDVTVTLNTKTNIIKDTEYKTASSESHATEGKTAELQDETGSETSYSHMR